MANDFGHDTAGKVAAAVVMTPEEHRELQKKQNNKTKKNKTRQKKTGNVASPLPPIHAHTHAIHARTHTKGPGGIRIDMLTGFQLTGW